MLPGQLESGWSRCTEHSAVVCVSHVDGRADVSLHTSGIISKTTVGAGCSPIDSSDWTKVDGHISERACCNKATAYARWKRKRRAAVWCDQNGAIVFNAFAIATKAGWAAVEDRRVLGRRSIFGPVPILLLKKGFVSSDSSNKQKVDTHRLISLVPALLPQRLLVRPRKPAMPRQKVARKVNVQSPLNVSYNEIVKLPIKKSKISSIIQSRSVQQQRTRDLAPAETLAGVLGGKLCKHKTALT